MKKWVIILCLLSCMPNLMQAQINLFNAKGTAYTIVLPDSASSIEKQSAFILADYLERVSGHTFPIVSEPKPPRKYRISIGETEISRSIPAQDLASEHFRIEAQGQDLFFKGTGKGLLYGVYHFIEDQLGCRKWYAGEPAVCPDMETFKLTSDYQVQQGPAFQYREVYFPVESDLEYINWHKLHRLDDLWGWWGHTYTRMVPLSYFETHPEYFAYYNGERRANQLCLSNPDVLKLALAAVQEAIESNPEATFWSISPNDDPVYCTCDLCKAVDALEGGPQGSLIRFVNKIAAAFPNQHFTSLAYLSTANPPKLTKALPNVTILLSNIDAARTLPINLEPSAAPFRRQADGWKDRAKRVFLWDYYTQFTNYLAPFPNIPSFQENLRYYQKVGIQGIFAQGSGETYSDMAELKSYLLAKLLWNPQLDVDSLSQEFLEGYYGKAAPYISEYKSRIEIQASKDTLDIYGNPVNAHNTFLTPEAMDSYSGIMDKAEAMVEDQEMFYSHIQKLRLSQEYTFLQQARFYGIHKHGIFEQEDTGSWQVRKGLSERIEQFVAHAEKYGVTVLAEGGLNPPEYLSEWMDILKKGVRPNAALGAKILPGPYKYVPEYPARGWETLIDGNPGYQDYSYNWLCFYGQPMEVTLDLHTSKYIEEISMDFLDDARHWIFPPQSLTLWGSQDGTHFEQIAQDGFQIEEEQYDIEKKRFTYPIEQTYRFIKVLAKPQAKMPAWRYHPNKKPMLACDEIWIQTKTTPNASVK